MEPNLRDTPLRRFNTFWWGLALFTLFAASALIIKCVIADDKTDLEGNAGLERAETLRQVTAKQLTERNTYKDNGDGTVKVKPEDVFALGKQMGLLEGPKASSQKHNKKF